MSAHADDALANFLTNKAHVAPKFLKQVLDTCDAQMIASIDNLQTLADAGMLGDIFKPVVAASISQALEGTPNVGGGTTPPPATAAQPPLSLTDVKRRLMAEGLGTWGTEDELRKRLSMILLQDALATAPVAPIAHKPTLTSQLGGAPAPPVAVAPAPPVAVASPLSSPPAAPPAAPPAPPATAEEASAAATSPPPAEASKSTFSVVLQFADGKIEYECPPDQFLLDEAEEKEIEGFEEVAPFACRAGSCSAWR